MTHQLEHCEDFADGSAQAGLLYGRRGFLGRCRCGSGRRNPHDVQGQRFEQTPLLFRLAPGHVGRRIQRADD
jgi:hypothetical protein